nr:MAG TPA: hypothetical protein [Caudoviricetes sp.]
MNPITQGCKIKNLANGGTRQQKGNTVLSQHDIGKYDRRIQNYK